MKTTQAQALTIIPKPTKGADAISITAQEAEFIVFALGDFIAGNAAEQDFANQLEVRLVRLLPNRR